MLSKEDIEMALWMGGQSDKDRYDPTSLHLATIVSGQEARLSSIEALLTDIKDMLASQQIDKEALIKAMIEAGEKVELPDITKDPLSPFKLNEERVKHAEAKLQKSKSPDKVQGR